MSEMALQSAGPTQFAPTNDNIPCRFDHPLPTLNMNIDAIDIETKDKHEGHFAIKNTGSGVLSGRVLSRCPGLTFSPVQFEGNTAINYTFDAAVAGLATGQSIGGHVYITSSGGEVRLPVTAKLAEMSIPTVEGSAIANLQDFYEYALVHPAQARRLFVDSEFYMLLLAIGYPYMEVYESLHKDPNRERAMDNFFILSGLKGKTTLAIDGDSAMEFTQKPSDTRILHGSIAVCKSDTGYIEAPITLQTGAAWLNCHASRLMPNDFDSELSAKVAFSVDPAKIAGNYAREVVDIGGNCVEVVYRRTPPVVIRIPRYSLKYEDRAVIEVINNTGKDMKIEVFCQDSYVRFSARSYIVGAYGEIPFNIKLSAFLSAQLFFRKLPYMKAMVEVKATSPGYAYTKKLPLVVGEW